MRRILTVLGSTLLGASLLLAACGGDETNTPTSPSAASVTEGVSFGEEVLPIIQANCASCHTGDGPGTTHLDMATADTIATNAEFIGFKIEDRQMPPWPVTELTEVAFDFDLGLPEADKATLLDWVAEGGVLDVEGSTPIESTAPAYPPLEADMTVAPSEPYTGPDDVRDDYRCRILDPGLTDESWLTGLEVVPDQTEVIHHALIFVAEAGTRRDADARAGSDGRAGWKCNTIPELSGGRLQQITAWAPGTGPFVVPDETGIRMDVGDYLIVQWHYHYDGDVPADSSALGLEFAPAGTTDLTPVESWEFYGPVEIPCATSESGPLCDRDAALSRIRSEFGFDSGFIPSFVNDNCGVRPEDFAEFTDGVARSSCDIRVGPANVVALWPHMHELGTEFRFTLNPGEPDEQVLLDIDKWDFDWQHAYIPTEPVQLEAGDVIRMECAWDRALWPPDLESRYIVWAEGTEDEMCYGTFTAVAG